MFHHNVNDKRHTLLNIHISFRLRSNRNVFGGVVWYSQTPSAVQSRAAAHVRAHEIVRLAVWNVFCGGWLFDTCGLLPTNGLNATLSLQFAYSVVTFVDVL